MPDDQTPMNEGEALDQAQPYRSPVSVSEGTAKAGVMKSTILWLAVLATTGAVAAGSFMYLLSPVRDFNGDRRPVRPVKEHVEDFGLYRTPIDDIEGFEADGVLSSESPSPVSNDSGEIPLP